MELKRSKMKKMKMKKVIKVKVRVKGKAGVEIIMRNNNFQNK
jgi:hypothetical protein